MMADDEGNADLYWL